MATLKPFVFDFLSTTLSSLSFSVGDDRPDLAQFVDFDGVKTNVIVPPTIKYVAFDTPLYSHKLVYVEKGKVREV